MSGWGKSRLRDRQSGFLPLSMALGLLVLTVAGLGIAPPRRLQVIEPGHAVLDYELDAAGNDMVRRQANARVR